MKKIPYSSADYSAISKLLIDQLQQCGDVFFYSSTTSNSNKDIDSFIQLCQKFSYEQLMIDFDLRGIEKPESYLDFCRFLCNMNRGSTYTEGRYAERVARILLLKLFGEKLDRTIIRLFRKCQVSHLLHFLEIYDINEKQ